MYGVQVSVIQRRDSRVPAGESDLFTIRTPRKRVDAERFLQIGMRPESSVIRAVRIDETYLRAVVNVRNRALLRARGNETQQRQRDDYNRVLHSSLHLLRFHMMVTFLSPPLFVGTVTVSRPLMTSGLFGSIVPLP